MSDTPAQLIPDHLAADISNTAALAAIMLRELKESVLFIEERLATSTANRTDVTQTLKIAQERATKQAQSDFDPASSSS